METKRLPGEVKFSALEEDYREVITSKRFSERFSPIFFSTGIWRFQPPGGKIHK